MRSIIILPFLGFLFSCAPPNAPERALQTATIDQTFAFGEGRTPRGATIRFAGSLSPSADGALACVAIGHNDAPQAKRFASEAKLALRFFLNGQEIDEQLRFAAVYSGGTLLLGKSANCALLDLQLSDAIRPEDVTLRLPMLRIRF